MLPRIIIIEPTHEHKLLRKLNQLGVRNGEGINIPAVQQVNRALPSAIPSNSTQNDKALAKKLARRYKVNRLAQTNVRGRISTCVCRICWIKHPRHVIWPSAGAAIVSTGRYSSHELRQAPMDPQPT